jgi:hypothetical protein
MIVVGISIALSRMSPVKTSSLADRCMPTMIHMIAGYKTCYICLSSEVCSWLGGQRETTHGDVGHGEVEEESDIVEAPRKREAG